MPLWALWSLVWYCRSAKSRQLSHTVQGIIITSQISFPCAHLNYLAAPTNGRKQFSLHDGIHPIRPMSSNVLVYAYMLITENVRAPFYNWYVGGLFFGYHLVSVFYG